MMKGGGSRDKGEMEGGQRRIIGRKERELRGGGGRGDVQYLTEQGRPVGVYRWISWQLWAGGPAL